MPPMIYTQAGRGTRRVFQEHHQLGWGIRVLCNTFTQDARGSRNVVMEQHQATGRGTRNVQMTFRQDGRGRRRIANDAMTRWEIYKGIDTSPDFDAAPWETFTSSPHETAAVDADHTYHIVTRKRNKYGQLTRNIEEKIVEVDSDGNLVAARPSAPLNVEIKPAESGKVKVFANYFYREDGDNAASKFLVYLTLDGDDPDPDVDEPVEVAMKKSSGLARLDETIIPSYKDNYPDSPFAGAPRMTSFDYASGGSVTWDANGYLKVGPASGDKAVAYYQDFDDRADVLVNAKVRVKNTTSGYQIGPALRIHPANKTFYTGYISVSGKATIARSDGFNNMTILAQDVAVDNDKWYKTKFLAESTTLKFKYWLADGTEPVTGGPDDDGYQIKTTDANYATGKVGVFGSRGGNYEVHFDEFDLPAADGSTIKTLVRTRRVDAGPVNADSDNVDIYSCTSNTDGPDTPEGDLFLSDELAQKH